MDDILHSSAEHSCRREICMKTLETNMQESEHNAEYGNSEHKKSPPRPAKTKCRAHTKKSCHMDVVWVWEVNTDQKTTLSYYVMSIKF